ncbi:MAG TPA: tRNA 2-thiouridine(34) synthase MnmA [Solirubrobacteraceae bacterium]
MTLATGLAQHLERPLARGHAPANAHTGAAGGAACGDLIRISLALDAEAPDGRILDAGFDASGCGATIAAGSAVVALLRGMPLLDAARIAPETIAQELGGLTSPKRHAAELAADALHRALGSALRQASLAPVSGRTLVAMSGGVDSAVAALLSAQSGDETVAVTLELWSDPANDGDLSCCSAQAVRCARSLAHDLDVPHFSIDLRAEFRAGVVEPWLSEHAAGLTPNPCVRCNGSVRLDAMLDLATRLGARTLATGHYARIDRDAPTLAPLLRTAVDPAKDQSYALSALAPDSLARMRFPLGELSKPEVRAIARRAGLPVAARRDSQDLCFLAGTRRADFLARHGSLGAHPGPILDRDGRLLGEHAGVHSVTVGQRRGLGSGAGLDRAGEPLYVLGTDHASNTVTVGAREELLTRTVRVRDTTLHRNGERVDAIKVRYRGARLACRLAVPAAAGERAAIEVTLHEPAERTAPGQIACLYDGDLIVGHGTIV